MLSTTLSFPTTSTTNSTQNSKPLISLKQKEQILRNLSLYYNRDNYINWGTYNSLNTSFSKVNIITSHNLSLPSKVVNWLVVNPIIHEEMNANKTTMDSYIKNIDSLNSSYRNNFNDKYYNQRLNIILNTLGQINPQENFSDINRLYLCNEVFRFIIDNSSSEYNDIKFANYINDNYIIPSFFNSLSYRNKYIINGIKNFIIQAQLMPYFPLKNYIELLNKLIKDKRFMLSHQVFKDIKNILSIQFAIAYPNNKQVLAVLNKYKDLSLQEVINTAYVEELVYIAQSFQQLNDIEQVKIIYLSLIEHKDTILNNSDTQENTNRQYFNIIHTNLAYIYFIQEQFKNAYENFKLALSDLNKPNSNVEALYYMGLFYENPSKYKINLPLATSIKQSKHFSVVFFQKAATILKQNPIPLFREFNIVILRNYKITGIKTPEIDTINGLIEKKYIKLEEVYPDIQQYNDIDNIVKQHLEEVEKVLDILYP